mmetsp:Transcript_2490/g.5200  ORF Transcript_2490/g.5200 Transcript_2490/m.5200 type:complete len:298 (+) Transcript_2490:2852-3745(+)
MENLGGLADKVKGKFEKDFKHLLHTGYGCTDVELCCANFLEFDWTDGDVVFANSTCFTDKLMASIAGAAQGMKPGSFLVTFTKGIVSDAFELVEKKRYNMSWGPATVFIHRRLTEEGDSAGPAVLQSYQTSPPQNLSYPGDGSDGATSSTGPLEVTGKAMKLNNVDTLDENNGGGDGGEGYIGEDDVDSGFYSHHGSEGASSSVFTPSTSVNSSFDTQASTGTPNTSYNSDVARPPSLDTTGNGPVAPLSPGMRRIYAEEQLGVMTSPKDTMLMQRKRMRGKGKGTQNANDRESLFA